MRKAPFDLITKKTSHPLDNGWSWVIMLAAFGSQFIVIGYQRSFGLLFVAFQERYGYSSGLLSAVNGTQSLSYSFSTMLVMNFVLKKVSVRTSCLLGVLLQAAGTVVCSVYSDMASLIVCQGIFFGLGHSLLYCPTILILSQYFDRHRSIATAVAMCGAGAGGIAFPYITRYLLNVFGLDGAMLILGALIFNQSVFYALFQPILIEITESTSSSGQPQDRIHSSSQNDLYLSNENNNDIPFFVVRDDEECFHDNPTNKSAITIDNANEQQNNEKHNHDKNDKLRLFRSDQTNSSALIARVGKLSLSHRIIPSPVNGNSLGDGVSFVGVKDKLYSSHGILPTSRDARLSEKSRELLSMLGGSTNGIHSSLPEIMGPVYEERSAVAGDCEQFSQQYGVGFGDNSDTDDPTAVSLLGKEDAKPETVGGCMPAVVRLPAFWLVAVYIIGGIIAAGCPALYIPPLSKEKGLTHEQATFFLTISATVDFIGRIGSGLVLHFKLIDACNLALVPLGLFTLFFNLTPLFNDFSSVLLLTLQYGLASSMFWTLMSLVIIDVLGLANLGPAMGFYAVIYGVTTSASFPFAGWLHDETGSYSSSFHYFGTMSFVAALALLAILIPRYRAKCVTLKCCQSNR